MNTTISILKTVKYKEDVFIFRAIPSRDSLNQ